LKIYHKQGVGIMITEAIGKSVTAVCPDGKERYFRYYEDNTLRYENIKDGKRYGTQYHIKKQKWATKTFLQQISEKAGI
jgi:hypothetical protein